MKKTMNCMMDLNQQPLDNIFSLQEPSHPISDQTNLILSPTDSPAPQLHLMTTIDSIQKSELPSPLHLNLEEHSVIQPPSESFMTIFSSALPTLANKPIKTSSEKLDEIFDIVCKNEGVIKEPSSLTKLSTHQANQSRIPKATIIPAKRVDTKHFCTLCNKMFSAERYYKQHYNSVHLHSGPKRYKCMLCQRSFHTERALQKHIDHEVYKPHNCDECERTFNRKPDLIRHSYVHRKSKPYICMACQKSFIRSDQLTSHHKNCTLGINSKSNTSIVATDRIVASAITKTTTLTNLIESNSNGTNTLASL